VNYQQKQIYVELFRFPKCAVSELLELRLAIEINGPHHDLNNDKFVRLKSPFAHEIMSQSHY
jgi:hypothetical protein